jgi:hypothetical protein
MIGEETMRIMFKRIMFKFLVRLIGTFKTPINPVSYSDSLMEQVKDNYFKEAIKNANPRDSNPRDSNEKSIHA